MENGPVIASKVQLPKAFISHNSAQLGSSHGVCVIITGWKVGVTGETWTCLNTQGFSEEQEEEIQEFAVAVGQFGIDSNVVIPKQSMMVEYWHDGPYVEVSDIGFGRGSDTGRALQSEMA